MGVLGRWNDVRKTKKRGKHVASAVSGYDGGKTVDSRRLGHAGITVPGMTKRLQNGVIYFEDDLVRNIAQGDEDYFDVLREADAYVERNGLSQPVGPDALKLQDARMWARRQVHRGSHQDAGPHTDHRKVEEGARLTYLGRACGSARFAKPFCASLLGVPRPGPYVAPFPRAPVGIASATFA